MGRCHDNVKFRGCDDGDDDYDDNFDNDDDDDHYDADGEITSMPTNTATSFGIWATAEIYIIISISRRVVRFEKLVEKPKNDNALTKNDCKTEVPKPEKTIIHSPNLNDLEPSIKYWPLLISLISIPLLLKATYSQPQPTNMSPVDCQPITWLSTTRACSQLLYQLNPMKWIYQWLEWFYS